MTVVIQISDTHFGTERPEVVAALRELIHSRAPGLVVLSGDVTQRARRSQFAAARRFVTELDPVRVVAIPGNHDIPLFNPVARLFFPYANYARAFGRELEPAYESDALLVLCVNTTRWFRHKDGEVSQQQIARVADRLRIARRGQLRIVVTHQPLLVIRDQDSTNLLHGHERALRSWSAAGADVFMGGHIHLPYVRPVSDSFPGLERSAWIVQAGTAVSRRVRAGAPNSINVLRYDQPAPGETSAAVCDIERWDYDAANACFGRIGSQRIELARDPEARASDPALRAARS